MTQLEFHILVASLQPSPAPPVRVRCKRRLLDFVEILLRRKYRKKLPDIDLMVLLALAMKSPRLLRFTEVLDCLPGASQTGVWKSLERLEDHGMVFVGGPPSKHTYEITADGVKELHYLTK